MSEVKVHQVFEQRIRCPLHQKYYAAVEEFLKQYVILA